MINLANYSAVLFDMDGTIYRGVTALPGVNELLQFLSGRGLKYACVTNNSSLTPAQYEAKLGAMGVAISAAHVVTSSTATRRYLEDEAPAGTRMYHIGMEGLHEALFGDGYYVYDEEQPQYVVVGLDTEATYAKFRTAALAIRKGARFIGTNPDFTLPTEIGLVPGAGSLQAFVRAATDVQPFVIGKPAPTMLLAAAALLGAEATRTLVVGDRIDTDIAGAIAAGMDSALVLTGVATAGSLKLSAVQPNAVYDDLVALLAAWKEV